VFFARQHIFDLLSQEKALSFPDKEKVFELEAATEFIKDQYGATLYKLNSMGANRITFWLLWTLFPPQTVVYSTDSLNQPRATRVLTTAYYQKQDGSWGFCVSCENIASNGISIGYTAQVKSNISEFQDIVDTHSLNVFPLECHPDAQDIKSRLITRGRKALALEGRHVQEYNGLALTDYNLALERFSKFYVGSLTLLMLLEFNFYV